MHKPLPPLAARLFPSFFLLVFPFHFRFVCRFSSTVFLFVIHAAHKQVHTAHVSFSLSAKCFNRYREAMPCARGGGSAAHTFFFRREGETQQQNKRVAWVGKPRHGERRKCTTR